MADKSHSTNPPVPFSLNGMVNLGNLPDDLDVFIYQVDTDKLAPSVNKGDLVFINSRRKAYEGPGLYLMGSGALARCQPGSKAGTVKVTRGRGHKENECSFEIFEMSSEGKCFKRWEWFIVPSRDLVQEAIDRMNLPFVKRSDGA